MPPSPAEVAAIKARQAVVQKLNDDEYDDFLNETLENLIFFVATEFAKTVKFIAEKTI